MKKAAQRAFLSLNSENTGGACDSHTAFRAQTPPFVSVFHQMYLFQVLAYVQDLQNLIKNKIRSVKTKEISSHACTLTVHCT